MKVRPMKQLTILVITYTYKFQKLVSGRGTFSWELKNRDDSYLNSAERLFHCKAVFPHSLTFSWAVSRLLLCYGGYGKELVKYRRKVLSIGVTVQILKHLD